MFSRARLVERLVAPRVPVDGIGGVLQEVRAALARQTVHPVMLTYNPVLMEFAVETRGLARDLRIEARGGRHRPRSVPAGSFYGFLGPNGAGKSTTIKCLTGLLRPTAGEMRILGIDPLADPVEIKRRVGVVPEDLALFDRLTAAETLELRRRRSTACPPRRSRRARPICSSLMDLTGGGDHAGRRFLARHAQEAVARRGAAAGAAPALSRRAVRRHRRRRVAADQGAAALVRRARRHGLPDLAHPRDRRAAVDAHRRHRQRPDRRAGARSTTSAPARTARARSKSCSSSWSAASAPAADLNWL